MRYRIHNRLAVVLCLLGSLQISVVMAQISPLDYGLREAENGVDRYCVFASRKDAFTHTHTHNEILDKYGSRIDYIDDALSGAALIKLYCQLEAEGKAEGNLASSSR